MQSCGPSGLQREPVGGVGTAVREQFHLVEFVTSVRGGIGPIRADVDGRRTQWHVSGSATLLERLVGVPAVASRSEKFTCPGVPVPEHRLEPDRRERSDRVADKPERKPIPDCVTE